jgi:hypothetical protein
MFSRFLSRRIYVLVLPYNFDFNSENPDSDKKKALASF